MSTKVDLKHPSHNIPVCWYIWFMYLTYYLPKFYMTWLIPSIEGSVINKWTWWVIMKEAKLALKQIINMLKNWLICLPKNKPFFAGTFKAEEQWLSHQSGYRRSRCFCPPPCMYVRQLSGEFSGAIPSNRSITRICTPHKYAHLFALYFHVLTD